MNIHCNLLIMSETLQFIKKRMSRCSLPRSYPGESSLVSLSKSALVLITRDNSVGLVWDKMSTFSPSCERNVQKLCKTVCFNVVQLFVL